jgi:hypothetical protein
MAVIMKIAVFWDVYICVNAAREPAAYIFMLKEMLLPMYQTTWHYIPEDGRL